MSTVDCCKFRLPVLQVNLVDFDVEAVTPAQILQTKVLTRLYDAGHGVCLRRCDALTV